MKMLNLKSYLVGAGSTLEISPNTDLDDVLSQIYDEASRQCSARERQASASWGLWMNSPGCLRAKNYHLTFTESYQGHIDAASLANDWKVVGADLLIAHDKPKQTLPKASKDESECWGL